jgi:hypothetical protein
MEEMLTAPEFAEQTRMSIGWVRKQIFEEKIKTCRIGRKVFIPKGVLEELIEKGMSEPKQD